MRFTLDLAVGETVPDYPSIAAVLRNVADDVEEPFAPPEITGPCSGRIYGAGEILAKPAERSQHVIGEWAVTEDPAPAAQLWITTGPLAEGGVKVVGPFESGKLAFTVRSYVEAADRELEGKTFWVVEEPGVPRTQDLEARLRELIPHDITIGRPARDARTLTQIRELLWGGQ